MSFGEHTGKLSTIPYGGGPHTDVVLLEGLMMKERVSLLKVQLSRELKKELALPGAFRMTTAPARTAMPRYVRLVMMIARSVPLGIAIWGF